MSASNPTSLEVALLAAEFRKPTYIPTCKDTDIQACILKDIYAYIYFYNKHSMSISFGVIKNIACKKGDLKTMVNEIK